MTIPMPKHYAILKIFRDNSLRIFNNLITESEIQTLLKSSMGKFTPGTDEYKNAKKSYDVLINPQKRKTYNDAIRKALQKEKAKFLAIDPRGYNKLFSAISSNNNHAVQEIILQAKIVNIFESVIRAEGINALHHAVNFQNIVAVECLAKDIDINSKTHLECTPLRLALKNYKDNESNKIVVKLIELGADVTTIDGDGNSLLGYAIKRMRIGSKLAVNDLVLAAENHGKLDSLIESYIDEDKAKRPAQLGILARLGQNSEDHFRKKICDRLLHLTEFLDNPEILLPAIDRLKEKGVIPTEETRASEVTFVERLTRENAATSLLSLRERSSSNNVSDDSEGPAAKRIRTEQVQAGPRQIS